MAMAKNVGTVDKTIRILLGLGVIGCGVYFQSWWGAVGAVPLITGLVNYCPLYSLIGVSTCRTK